MSIVVDGADYFSILENLMSEAQQQVLLIGWDFDTRVKLRPESGGPTLGKLINRIAKSKPDLDVYILKWNLSLAYSIYRMKFAPYLLRWFKRSNIHFQNDDNHPPGACHHRKLVIIDDKIVFCGGIDITAGRWDTSNHLDNDKRRGTSFGRSRPPFHDVTAMMEGPIAKELGDYGREKWCAATGETIPAPQELGHRLWPDKIKSDFENIQVGFATTEPKQEGNDEHLEIEQMYERAICLATDYVYIESQYFSSAKIYRAALAQIKKPDGPEIIVIAPQCSDGWMEQKTLDATRDLFIAAIQRADTASRFGYFYPVTQGNLPIYVHAKIMIVDDRFIKVGSSNVNNRSMGYDSECDVALEIKSGDAHEKDNRQKIRDIRDRLISEHLGMSSSEFNSALETEGSVLTAIKNSARENGRSLRRYVPTHTEPSAFDKALTEVDIFDPERPIRTLEKVWTDLAKLIRRK